MVPRHLQQSGAGIIVKFVYSSARPSLRLAAAKPQLAACIEVHRQNHKTSYLLQPPAQSNLEQLLHDESQISSDQLDAALMPRG